MKKKSSKIMLLLLTALLLFAMPMTANAASTKTKAMKAYSKMLAKSKLTIKNFYQNKNHTYQTSKLAFATAYLNNDNVPELIVKLKKNKSTFEYFIFTYKNGKVKQAYNIGSTGATNCKLGYCKKKSVLVDVIGHNGYWYYKYGNGWYGNYGIAAKGRNAEDTGWVYYKLAPGLEITDITKSAYNALIKKYTGSTKITTLSFVKNTKKNRSKKLK